MLQNIFRPHHSIEMNFSSIHMLEGESYGRNSSHISDSILLSLETLVISRCYLVWTTRWLPWSYWDRLWLLPLILYGKDSPLLFQKCIFTFFSRNWCSSKMVSTWSRCRTCLSTFFYIWGYHQKIITWTFIYMVGQFLHYVFKGGWSIS